jgi:hypothetical protein
VADPEIIVFVDAEDVLCTWLAAQLDALDHDLPVGTRVPDPRPDRFIRLIRTGGVRYTLVTDAAQVAVECWDVVESAAAAMAQLCRGLINAAPVNLPDVLTGHARYTQTFEIHLRGTAVQAQP